MTRIFCIGDIHNNHKSLIQCLERSSFNYDKDTLICLGDVYDGYPDAYESVEELLKIKNLILIKGNHDFPWAYDFLTKGSMIHIHLSQGGLATVLSYQKNGIPNSHIRLLNTARSYYIHDNKLFVHGGYNWKLPIDEQSDYELMWDRKLIEYAITKQKYSKRRTNIKPYDEIFLGHTCTQKYNTSLPIRALNVWNLDTGAGFNGRLTIMNVDTHEFFQSDTGDSLYGQNQGRG